MTTATQPTNATTNGKFSQGQKVVYVKTGEVLTVVAHASPCEVVVEEKCLHFHPSNLRAVA